MKYLPIEQELSDLYESLGNAQYHRNRACDEYNIPLIIKWTDTIVDLKVRIDQTEKLRSFL